MTAQQIPRWTLIIAAVLVAAAIGFALTQLLAGSDDSAPAPGAGDPAKVDDGPTTTEDDDDAAREADREGSDDVAALPCDEEAATRAVNDAGAELVGSRRAAIETRRGLGYEIDEVECADLTGDGLDEMVVELTCCTPSTVDPWGVFGQRDQRWMLLLAQPDHDVSAIEVDGNAVVERIPTRGVRETAEPRGEREARVEFAADGSYTYRAEGLPERPVLAIRELGQARAGPFRAATGTPGGAIDDFGEPSTISKPVPEACAMNWADLGLEILFANFGGGNPCRLGRAQEIRVFGRSGELAGWRTASGLAAGATVDRLYALYPNAGSSEGGLYDLEFGDSPYGEAGEYAMLSAVVSRGVVSEIVLRPLAAGD